jgi:2-keto-3-deoxy-L-rhamnonate aldolase RhmA
MKQNKTRQRLMAGGCAIGTMISKFPSAAVPRLLAAAGFDFAIIDTEHSHFSFGDIQDIARAAKPTDLSVFVRVTDAEYHLIARTLDVGAEGVMAPRVEDRETVQRVVDAARYAPLGKRGYGIGTIHSDYQSTPAPEVIRHMNENVLVIVQIESKTAVERLDDVLSVPGVDVAMLGVMDLSLSLGVPGEIANPVVVERVKRVIEACGKHGVAPGIHLGDMAALKKWRDEGMRCLMFSSEERMLFGAAVEAVKALTGR